MKKIFALLLIIGFYASLYGQRILMQDYNFLVTDGEIKKLRQRNDTLFELKCSIDYPCLPHYTNRYKIIDLKHITADLAILKLERLDTIPLTTEPYPANRFVIFAFRKINDNTLEFLPLDYGLTREQIDAFRVKADTLAGKFFFIYYSDSYLNKLTALKTVSSKEDAVKIVELLKSNKFGQIIKSYKEANTGDMYASGLAAQLLTLACIELGYNPVGAGRKLNALMKE